MYDAMMAETVSLAGHGGDRIWAYLARPLSPGPHGGVVVIHHMPGWDEHNFEITRRFAGHGYLAICPYLYSREAASAGSVAGPGASPVAGPVAGPEAALEAVRAAGGVPDERLVGDVAGAAAYLRGQASSNGRAGVIGYCSGGRQSFLSAASLDLQAAVICYGAFIVGEPPAGMPLRARSLLDLVPRISCPLLGLFGAEDSHPSPEQTAQLSAALDGAGKAHQFHTFEGAGHAFFVADRPSYRQAAAVEGWGLIWQHFGHHLA